MDAGKVAGIDWASEVHVACVMDADGTVAGRFSFTYDPAAIEAMVRRLRTAGVAGWRSKKVTAQSLRRWPEPRWQCLSCRAAPPRQQQLTRPRR